MLMLLAVSAVIASSLSTSSLSAGITASACGYCNPCLHTVSSAAAAASSDACSTANLLLSTASPSAATACSINN
jgi:hypothetical protein